MHACMHMTLYLDICWLLPSNQTLHRQIAPPPNFPLVHVGNPLSSSAYTNTHHTPVVASNLKLLQNKMYNKNMKTEPEGEDKHSYSSKETVG